MSNYFHLLCLSLFLYNSVSAQDTYKRNKDADVNQYVFNISLNDLNNEIVGEAQIEVGFSQTVDTFILDLITKKGKYGMEVSEVLENGEKANYSIGQDKVIIQPTPDQSLKSVYLITYKGIPEKGLVIDRTKYGERSFFGDNWPNLARYWLPCVDHPYDKAAVEFRVTAPEYYEVVATGKKIEESNLGGGIKLTSYIERAPVATKVMTIGVTRFASHVIGNVGDVEVSAWVYPENRLKGFADFEESASILEYFIEEIGPYSYAKLANVQSRTRWGGLENAGTITYKESSVDGSKQLQRLMAHEIAHQWFGNSATEKNWNQVWLSEGFATYFAILYQENVLGDEKRKEELRIDRDEVIAYYDKNPASIVDLSISDPEKVLNTNSYQKGGWVLNMLRCRLGDDIFWKGIQNYYQRYRDANANSKDFQKIMEETSGDDLETFFRQWLHEKGFPEIKWSWTYKNGKLKIRIKQEQRHFLFDFPLEFGIVNEGSTDIKTIQVKERSTTVIFDLEAIPDQVIIDPGVWLLFEEK